MTWMPPPLVEMECRVCRATIHVSEKFSVCQFTRKDGVTVRWLRCEKCQRKTESINSYSVIQQLEKVQTMERMKYRIPKVKS